MKFFLALLFLASSLFALPEKERIERLQAFILLDDKISSLSEADLALKEYPDSKGILETVIRLYANYGEEAQMMRTFRNYQKYEFSEELPRDLIEDMAWGTIWKGSKSSMAMIRAISLIAAAFGNDARGVGILSDNMDDQNRLIRLLSINFASHFRDYQLQDAVLTRLPLEKDPLVKLELISAIGAMHITTAEKFLIEILSHDRASAEEKLAAIESMLALKEEVDRKTIETLVKSKRVGLRSLAAELIRVNNKQEDADLLLPLLEDPHPEVREMALYSLGTLRVSEVQGKLIENLIKPLTKDHHHEVAITAAWTLALLNAQEGQKILATWLKHDKQDIRLHAACALTKLGKYGFPLTLQAFKESNDTYVKMNLALALIQQRVKAELGAQALFDAISTNKDRWMEKKMGRFEGIAKSDEAHRADIANYPEAVNQVTRLELLNILAILKYPGTEQAIQQFLKEKNWGVTGEAAALLLTEGDEETLELIRDLLNDDSEKVRLQAALVLGLWGSDPEALATLEELYPLVPKNRKESILEAMGRVGELSSVPFLLDRLEDPQQKTRMIAAAGLIRILYH